MFNGSDAADVGAERLSRKKEKDGVAALVAAEILGRAGEIIPTQATADSPAAETVGVRAEKPPNPETNSEEVASTLSVVGRIRPVPTAIFWVIPPSAEIECLTNTLTLPLYWATARPDIIETSWVKFARDSTLPCPRPNTREASKHLPHARMLFADSPDTVSTCWLRFAIAIIKESTPEPTPDNFGAGEKTLPVPSRGGG